MFKGLKHSARSIAKMIKAKRLNHGMTGRKHKPETRELMSLSKSYSSWVNNGKINMRLSWCLPLPSGFEFGMINKEKQL